MGATRLAWAIAAGLVAFAGLTAVGILAEAGGVSGGAEMLVSITALECLALLILLRPRSFTHLDGGRALLAFALSVPWSAIQLIEHLDVSAGFGARLMWLLIAQISLLIVAVAGWAHCRRGLDVK